MDQVDDLVRVVCAVIRRRHDLRSGADNTFNAGGASGWSRADFTAAVCDCLGASTCNMVRMTRKECSQAWAHTYPVPADIRMRSDKLERFLGPRMLGGKAGIRLSLRQHEKETL